MDIYDKLLEIVSSGEDLEDFLTHEESYEYLYHLSQIRQNVIEWFSFKPDARLLELGAECGALTGLFAKRVREVVAVEDNEKKTAVNKERNRTYNNITYVTGEGLNELTRAGILSMAKGKAGEAEGSGVAEDTTGEDGIKQAKSGADVGFDYVTIIGGFTMDKLKTASFVLKPGGTLIIAVENKYGMRYWSGEERPYTYSRSQLMGQLKYRGYDRLYFFYPVPDYTFPLEIYSEKNLPTKGSIKQPTPVYLKDKILTLDEVKQFDMVIEDKKFEEYANSFVVVAHK